MSAQSPDTGTTPYVCPTCSAPLVAEETPKGADWMTLFCPECKTSHKWRGSRIGVGMRVFFIVFVAADWIFMAVDAHWRNDSFRQLLALVGVAVIAWAIVGLVQMARTAARWKRSSSLGAQ
jgi:DNA-directed RNA polymerase subunit RPC12/RpoP